MLSSTNMKCTWIAWVFVFACVYALDPPSNLSKHPQPSNLHINSKNLNKSQHKTFRTPNNPKTSPFNPEITSDIVEASFPDVIYPTSILEAAQPFYFSQAVNDGVLGPFSNDVKTSYKTLTSGKGKLDGLVTNGTPSLKLSEKGKENYTSNIVNQTVQNITQEMDQNNTSLSAIQSLVETTNGFDGTELPKNSIFYEDELETLVSNSTTDTHKIKLHLHQETPENIFEDNYYTTAIQKIIICNESMENIENMTNNDIEQNETLNMSKEDIQVATEIALNNSTNNQSLTVTPSYVITSGTENSYKEFFSDIMNIYSLIEETIRAISVVEFVVTKALDTLEIVNNLNVTTASPIVNSSVTNAFNSYNLINNDTVNNCCDNDVDVWIENNLIETSQLLTGENGANTVLDDYYDNIVDDLTVNNLLEARQLLTGEKGNDTVLYDHYDNIVDNFTINNLLETRQSLTGEKGDDKVLNDYYENIIENLTMHNLFETSQLFTGEISDDTTLYDYFENIVDNLTVTSLLQTNHLLTLDNGINQSVLSYDAITEEYTSDDFSFDKTTTTCFLSNDDVNNCTFDNTADENIKNYNVIRERR